MALHVATTATMPGYFEPTPLLVKQELTSGYVSAVDEPNFAAILADSLTAQFLMLHLGIWLPTPKNNNFTDSRWLLLRAD